MTSSHRRPSPSSTAANAAVAALLAVILFPPAVPALAAQDGPTPPWPPVATFSIVGFDPATGEVGAAVQSRVFSVGNGVIWGEAGVGVVATQAIVDVSYGPQALALLREGRSPTEVVREVLALDPDPDPERWTKEGRQFSVMSAAGEVATHTGPRASEWAGHRIGEHCSAQGNILAGPAVVNDMVTAFESTEGHISLRLQAALEAGQAAGGDTRGMQSAAMLVVKEDGGVWLNNDVVLRLQVDDHPQPIAELRRLVEKAAAQRDRRSRSGADEQIESPLVELDRPAMLAKVREAHDMSARLHGPNAHAVARDEWGLPLDQALGRVNHLLLFWSETLGPYPAPGETYMRFGRDGEQIEDFAHMAGRGNCNQRVSIRSASSSARISGGGSDEVLVSGTAGTVSSVSARHSTSGWIRISEDRRGEYSLHGDSDCDWRGSATRAWSFPTPEDETFICVDVNASHRAVTSVNTSVADTNSRECGTFGGRDDDGGGGSCAGNDECTYPGGTDDYPDVGSGFTCYWVADSSDTDDGGYWLCLRGS